MRLEDLIAIKSVIAVQKDRTHKNLSSIFSPKNQSQTSKFLKKPATEETPI